MSFTGKETHQVTNSSLLTRPQTPTYNTGHGDFCFGRLSVRERLRRERDHIERSLFHVYTNEEINANSNNVRDVFERDGPFLFFKLPLEIRRRIFRLLLEPFYSQSDHPLSYHTVVAIRPIMSFTLQEAGYGGDYGSYLERIDETGIASLPTLKSCWADADAFIARDDMSDEEYYCAKAKLIRELEPHPERSYPYRMECHVWKPAFSQGPCHDWPMIALVRHMSHVSTQFRQELGDAFWTNAQLNCVDDWHLESIEVFLQERPAIHKFITTVSMSLDICQDDHSATYQDVLSEAGKTKVLSLFQSLSKNLALHSFHVILLIDEEYLADFAHGEGPFGHLGAAFRSLNVTQRFKVSCIMKLIGGTNENYDDGDQIKRRVELTKEYAPIIRRLLKPDSLRPSNATDMDTYLNSRLSSSTNDSDTTSDSSNSDSRSDEEDKYEGSDYEDEGGEDEDVDEDDE